MSERYSTRRKLQFAGNSSYVLTLPKKWITSQNLNNKNSEVFIEELADSTLRISPSDLGDSGSGEEKYRIQVDENSQPEEVVRLLLGAYLASYHQIEVKSKNSDVPLPLTITYEVKQITEKLWGSEITAQTNTEIRIQDALNASSMSLNDCVERSWFTAKNMLELSFQAIFTKDENARKIVEDSENTLDKLYYLALRQLYKASSNYIFASDIGIRPSDIIDYHLLIKDIERVGDHCLLMVGSINSKFTNIDLLKDLGEEIIEITDMAIKAFRTLDPELAQRAIKNRKLIVQKADLVEFTLSEYPIIRSILRMADYSADIGELVINRKVAADSWSA
ncbi:MAG: PhoU domain-containing protein [Candidatus Kariarchaeaceae archaeon]